MNSRIVHGLLLALAAAPISCARTGTDEALVPDCGQPRATEYAEGCSSLNDAGANCFAGELPIEVFSSHSGIATEIDAEAAYPTGCVLTFPFCSGGKMATCQCSAETSAELEKHPDIADPWLCTF